MQHSVSFVKEQICLKFWCLFIGLYNSNYVTAESIQLLSNVQVFTLKGYFSEVSKHQKYKIDHN